MRILAFIHDRYGRRIAENITARAPESWRVNQLAAPRVLPPIVDDPLEFLPSELPESDLILHLAETAQAAQLIPGLVKLTRAEIVIAPVDNEAWLPAGLRLQLKRECAEVGAEILFPQPFCSLDLKDVTADSAHPFLREFTRYFGRPSLRIELAEDQKTVNRLEVERGAPCGSSQYAADRITGMRLDELVPQGGLICLHYPCLASMQPKTTDQGVETLMHTSGIIYNQSLEQARQQLKKDSSSEPDTHK
jgi:hypothetical protein